MFTRCPKCQTTHPLNAKVLSQARGLVQCGQCGRPFSALSFLFDERPSGQRPHAPATGPDTKPPVIGKKTRPAGEKKTAEDKRAAKESSSIEEKSTGEEKSTAKEKNTAQENKATDGESDEVSHNPHHLVWGLVAALLVLATIANLGWTFRQPLMQNPSVNTWLKDNGWLQVKRKGLPKATEQIQLISRDMHSHPTRSGILVLSLTFVNLAQGPQKYPVLEITLLDGSNQPIAQRRFQPADYLRPGADIKPGLAADVFLPVLLELGDPGEQAVGFEIRFL